MDINKFTIKSQEAIQQAQQLAETNGNQSIETGHLLKGIFLVDQEITPFLLNKLSVNKKILEAALDRIIDSYPKVSGGQVYLSPVCNRVLNFAIGELKNFGDEFVSIELLLFSLLDASDSTGKLLKDNNINKTNLKDAIMDLRKGQKVTSSSQEGTYQSLAKYAKNLNELAQSGKLDPVIGRDDEIRRVLQNHPATYADSSTGIGCTLSAIFNATTKSSAIAFLTNPFRDASDDTAPSLQASRKPVAKSATCRPIK